LAGFGLGGAYSFPLLPGADAAEADGVAAGFGGNVVAVSAAALFRLVIPGTTADHALLPVLVEPGAAVLRRAFVTGMPAILAPLPDVAVHVVEVPGVRLLLADGRIFALRVGLVPGVGAELLRLVAEAVFTVARAGPAGVFPLRLGRQADHLVILQQF